MEVDERIVEEQFDDMLQTKVRREIYDNTMVNMVQVIDLGM
jgi:hypothetical protein